jgi:hypothetical protein
MEKVFSISQHGTPYAVASSLYNLLASPVRQYDPKLVQKFLSKLGTATIFLLINGSRSQSLKKWLKIDILHYSSS